MKRIVLSCIFAASVCALNGQHAYTLEECRSLAAEHNRTLADSRIDRQIALQSKREALTGYFPQISATGLAFQGSKGLVQADFALPGLGTLPLSLMKNGLAASVTAVQPLFAGLQIVNGNKLARVGEEASRLQLQVSENEVMQRTTEYYWQIVTLKENLRTLDAVDAQLAEIYRQVKLSVETGLTTRNDLLRVELRRQEIASKRLQAENGLSVTEMLLAQHIGVDRRGFAIADASFAEPIPPLSYRISPEEALVRRAEYALLEKNVEAGKYRTRMERGKMLPKVGVGAGYTYYDLMDKSVNNGILFAEVSVPISSWWGGSHAVRRARLEESKARNERLDSQEMLIVEIERCWYDLEESYYQILLAEKSIASSTENLRLNRLYFEAGTSSLTEMLDAETLFRQSQDQYASACAAYRIKLSKYLQVTGR